MLVLTLLAFLLRVSNLGLESLDIDEADGAAFIASGLPELLARLFRNGENGPLYYLLLHLWSLAAGTTEWALRYPSVLVGTLTVPLVYALMRRLTDTRTALLAALLATASTYLIHYAQMVKMYALVAALAALATYAFLRALETGRTRWWLAHVATVSLTLYSHIFGVLLLPWHGAYVIMRWRALPRRTRYAWLVSLAVLTLPYLPLGLWHLENVRNIPLLTRQFTGATTLPGMLAELAAEYGTLFNGAPGVAFSLLFGSLALVGLVGLLWGGPRERQAGWFLGLGAIVPVGIIAVLVALGAPVYSPRYVIVALLPYLALWAAGLATALRRAPLTGFVGLAAVLALNGAHLVQRDVGGMAFREDWRAAMGYIGLRAQPGDGVIFLSSAAVNAFRYYGDPAAGLIDTEALRQQTGDVGFDTGMDALAGVQRRLWLVSSYFELPDYPPVQRWLSDHTAYEREVWFRNVRVALHAPAATPVARAAPAPGVPVFTFGDQLELIGIDRGALPRRAGEPWQVRLSWRALRQPDTDYALSLRVLDEQGNVVGRSEGPPGGAFQRTSLWQPDEIVVDDRDVPLAAGLPPGNYRVGLYVYRRDTVSPLAVHPSGDDAALAQLGTLTLDQAQPADLRLLERRIDAPFEGGVRLLGLEAEPVDITAGDVLPLHLLFEADEGAEGITAEMVLTDAVGRSASWSSPLAEGSGQSTSSKGPLLWRARIPLSPRFSGGPLRAVVRLRAQDGTILSRRGPPLPRSWRQQAELGAFELRERPKVFEVSAGLLEQGVRLGDGIALAGSSPVPAAIRRGDTARLRLAWRATGEPATRWTATVQLLDGGQRVIAQHDQVIGGGVPADGWTVGEVREDVFELRVPESAGPGRHTLILALYNPADGQRLPTESGSQTIELAKVDIQP